MWKEIKGYKYPYRISDMGVLEQFYHGKWRVIQPFMKGNRAQFQMMLPDGKRKTVPVVWFMAEAYMGGRRPGMDIVHKDGSKFNNAAYNLKFQPRKVTAMMRCNTRRKTIAKVSPDGEVVAVFRSIREAAEKEFVCTKVIRERCQGKIKDPYRINGYTYQYEDDVWKKEQ